MDGLGDGDVRDEQHIRDPSGDDGGTRGQHQQRPPNARQITLPFGQPPPPPTHKTNYKDFGLPEPRTELSIKVMDQFFVMRNVKKDVEELASSSCALDEEEREIESALLGSIIKKEPIEGGRLPSARATGIRHQQSNFSSPSNVANADTPSNNNVQGSQSFLRHAATSTQRRTVQLSIKPMMDAVQREKADKLWSMAQAVMGLPFRTFKHPVFHCF
ncbi:hypothetical protein R1sor_021508 [Riccia sorocarpa]|uniref:Uncharacterized protein n=1 Tax=Riccia sorocarpa TaxID=122646 RepID=A0ABD3GJ43_9MARC